MCRRACKCVCTLTILDTSCIRQARVQLHAPPVRCAAGARATCCAGRWRRSCPARCAPAACRSAGKPCYKPSEQRKQASVVSTWLPPTTLHLLCKLCKLSCDIHQRRRDCSARLMDTSLILWQRASSGRLQGALGHGAVGAAQLHRHSISAPRGPFACHRLAGGIHEHHFLVSACMRQVRHAYTKATGACSHHTATFMEQKRCPKPFLHPAHQICCARHQRQPAAVQLYSTEWTECPVNVYLPFQALNSWCTHRCP